MKIVLSVAMLLFVVGCASTPVTPPPPAPTAAQAQAQLPQPKPGFVNVTTDGKVVAEIELATGKVELKNGGTHEGVVLALINQLNQVSSYHELFKRDLVGMIGTGHDDKAKAKVAKVAAKAKTPHPAPAPKTEPAPQPAPPTPPKQ